jgi:lincosamide nucleotidyltransferase A/C/D/E
MTNTAEAPKPPEPNKAMRADDVISFYNQMVENDIDIWVDGGWGVDALLEKQTRPHGDLDIAVQEKDVQKMRELLAAKGYKQVPSDEERAWNFVLSDGNGHEIDVHVILIDETGNGIYGPKENGEMYPASSLTGRGVIDGKSVRCISAGDMVKFHSGYELDEDDYHDVSALCSKFGIPLPAEYEKFKQQ